MDETTKAAMTMSLALQAHAYESRRLVDERNLVLQSLRFVQAGLPPEAAWTALGISRATWYRRIVEVEDLLAGTAPADVVAAADQARRVLDEVES